MIIAKSPFVLRNGSEKVRIILKYENRCYMVAEKLMTGTYSYEIADRSYFVIQNQSGMAQDVARELTRNRAWLCFEKRCRKLLGLDMPDNTLADEIAAIAYRIIEKRCPVEQLVQNGDPEIDDDMDRFQDLTGLDLRTWINTEDPIDEVENDAD